MGLLSEIALLPLAPVRGVISLAELIQEQVDQEVSDPSSVRRDLEAAEEARARGEITAEEEAAIQERAMQRMTGEGTIDPREG
ncbi:gas vesicle protein GvpG [Prauserella oleivorans]|uniref:Gas vesicle protein GvpG n=1 Tax=Prauserella oleivorans TaxID=1478153 RepID=A0ABW5WCB5_9PSEU